MAISGFPDASKHCLCIRCRKWHEPHEGRLVSMGRRAPGILGAVSSAALLASGLEREADKPQFLCDACRRRRLRFRIVFICIAAATVGCALLWRHGR